MPTKLDLTPASALRVARVAAGYTQPQLAKQVKTTQTLLSKYERGLAVPKLDVARRLAQALKRPLEELFPPKAAAPKRRIDGKVAYDAPTP